MDLTSKTWKALILNDYDGAPYADWIKHGNKTIETRARSFNYRGDLVICCGKTNSVGKNAGKALCIVELWKIRPMKKSDAKAAGVEYNPRLKSFLLRNWRHFSLDFEFSRQRVSGAWQSIFELTIPSGIEIIPRPDIKPFQSSRPPPGGGGDVLHLKKKERASVGTHCAKKCLRCKRII